jgi:hypothetical protein
MGMGQWVYLYGKVVEKFLSNSRIRCKKTVSASKYILYTSGISQFSYLIDGGLDGECSVLSLF